MLSTFPPAVSPGKVRHAESPGGAVRVAHHGGISGRPTACRGGDTEETNDNVDEAYPQRSTAEAPEVRTQKGRGDHQRVGAAPTHARPARGRSGRPVFHPHVRDS